MHKKTGTYKVLSVYFVLFSLISFYFRWFRFISFSFRWFRFVSFRYRWFPETHLACLSITVLLTYITHNSIQAGFACRQTFRSSNVIFIKIIVFKKSNYLLFFISLFYFVLSFIFFLPFSSYQSISFCFRWFRFAFVGFVLFRFHFVDFVMSYFYLCLSVCQYLWIIKFLEWAYRKKGGIWGGIFIDWDIEGSFFL
jgi:hypothetical protein